MAFVQEARDPVVGRDPMTIDGERGHGSQAIAHAQPDGTARARSARLPARVKSVQAHDDRVQEGDHVDAPVGHLLVLEHEHRRAAGMRTRDHIEPVHTDGSVGIWSH